MNRRRLWGQTTGEWATLALVVIALLAGWGVRVFAENQTTPYEWDGLRFNYPSGWRVNPSSDGGQVIFRPLAMGPAPTRISVRSEPLRGVPILPQTLGLEGDRLTLSKAQALTAFRQLERTDQLFRGLPALLLDYAFVSSEAGIATDRLPTVMLGRDFLIYDGTRLLTVTLEAPEGDFARLERNFQGLLDSLQMERGNSP